MTYNDLAKEEWSRLTKREQGLYRCAIEDALRKELRYDTKVATANMLSTVVTFVLVVLGIPGFLFLSSYAMTLGMSLTKCS
jgi:hypothetical protein